MGIEPFSFLVTHNDYWTFRTAHAAGYYLAPSGLAGGTLLRLGHFMREAGHQAGWRFGAEGTGLFHFAPGGGVIAELVIDGGRLGVGRAVAGTKLDRSEEHTSELQSLR